MESTGNFGCTLLQLYLCVLYYLQRPRGGQQSPPFSQVVLQRIRKRYRVWLAFAEKWSGAATDMLPLK